MFESFSLNKLFQAIGRYILLSVMLLALYACGGDESEPRPVEDMTVDDMSMAAPASAQTVLAESPADVQPAATATATEPTSLAVQAPTESDEPAETVLIADATPPLVMDILSEHGYNDESGRLMIDVMQADTVYLMLSVEDADGRLVKGAEPVFSVTGASEIRKLNGHGAKTNALGGLRFALTGGEMGEDTLAVTLADVEFKAYLNVISQEANGYENLADIEGVIPWEQLLQAQINWDDRKMTTTFPLEIQAQNGKDVKLAGFMMPLEMGEEQKRFALTSNPPGCFYHIPGGPAGAVEVFAEDPIQVSWDPIVLEGRFEALPESDIGVAYRMRDARLVDAE